MPSLWSSAPCLLRDLASLVGDVDEVGGGSNRLAVVSGGLVEAVP